MPDKAFGIIEEGEVTKTEFATWPRLQIVLARGFLIYRIVGHETYLFDVTKR